MFEMVDVSRMGPEQALTVMERAHRDRQLAEAQEALALLRLLHAYRHPFTGDRSRIGGEGTPEVDDFVCLEVAAALRESPAAVSARAADLLDLEARHPRLWERVVAGGVPLWIGRRVAGACRGLPKAKALWVDATLAPFATRLGAARLLRFAEGLVARADPAAADERARQARLGRRVWVGDSRDGVSEVYGIIGAADGVFLDAALAQLSDILAAQGDTDDAACRRATALGILATPARALAMIQGALQPALGAGPLVDGSVVAVADGAPGDERAAGVRGPAGCAGHACGTITVEPGRLLPKSTLVVHLSDRTLLDGEGIGRAERIGPVTLEAVRQLLGHTQVTVRPVFDPDGIAPVDAYEIPADVRRAVLLRHPFDVFPYGTRPSARLDLDHTAPYRWDGTPAQTRPDNLGPLSRRAHRGKTHAGWRLAQPSPGRFCWTSPLGRRYTVTQTGLTLDGHPPGTRPWDDPLGGPLLPDLPPPRRRTHARNGRHTHAAADRAPRHAAARSTTPLRR